MKLARFDHRNGPRLGLVDGEHIVDLSSGGLSAKTMTALISAEDEGLKEVRAVAQVAPRLRLDQVRLLAPIERPGKYLAIGMNYAKHLEEADKLGVKRSAHQTWFNKQTTCIAGPYDDIDPRRDRKARLRSRTRRSDRPTRKACKRSRCGETRIRLPRRQRRVGTRLAVPHADVHNGKIVRYPWPHRPVDRHG